MTTAQLIQSLPAARELDRTAIEARVEARAPTGARPSVAEMLDDLLPVVGVIVQAGPPVSALAVFGAVVVLLACAPLVTLLVVLAISLVVAALPAAAVAGAVVLVRRRRG